MPEITERDLKKQIKDKDFACLYMIYGDEAYLKDYYACRICDMAVDSALRDFNFHRFEGKSLDFDALSDAVEAFPMMSARTCVLLKDVPVDALAQNERDKLMQILSDIPPTCTVVLWMDTVCVDAKKNAKWRSFINDISPYAALVALDKRGKSELIKMEEK